MPTIGRRWPKSRPADDYPATCAYCGATWRRSELRKDGAGLLVCPDEGDGRDRVTLSRLNARAAGRRRRRHRVRDGANVDVEAPVYSGDPADILGLGSVYAWFRADDAEVDGSSQIVTIKSRSPGNRALYQDTLGSRPLRTSWGSHTAILGATGKSLAGRVAEDWTVLHGTNDVTVGMLVRDLPASSTAIVTDGDLKLFPAHTTGALQVQVRNFAGIEVTLGVNWTLSKKATRQAVWYTRSVVAPNTTHKVYVNGELVKTGVGTNTRMVPRPYSALSVAPAASESLAELIVVEEVLTTDAMAQIEAYWAGRYP